MYWVLMARFWEGEEGLQGFSEKLLEASLMSNRVNASQLQDSPAWPRPSPSATVAAPLG